MLFSFSKEKVEKAKPFEAVAGISDVRGKKPGLELGLVRNRCHCLKTRARIVCFYHPPGRGVYVVAGQSKGGNTFIQRVSQRDVACFCSEREVC